MAILKIFLIFIVLNRISVAFKSFCLPCSSYLCYQCYNTLPNDRTNVEQLTIVCNKANDSLIVQERYYSIIKSYKMINCSMKTFYFDHYTLWNYLEYMSINYANLTDFSSIIFNRSLSLSSPILYSIKNLNFSHNSLQIINKNFSYYFPSLEILDLSYNDLIMITKRSFQNLINLKELYLNNNYLKQVLPNIFPRQSLNMINLNMNYWHCSCTNIPTLMMSQPIPKCFTPNEYQYQNASIIAQQCFLRKKTNFLITTNIHKKQNLTCTLSHSIFDIWKKKINKNITLLPSIWDIDHRHSLSLEHLLNISNQSDNYLVCFNMKSSRSESIYTIVNLTSFIRFKATNSTKFMSNTSLNLSTTTQTIIVIPSRNRLSPMFGWIFNTSKLILPKHYQTSDKHVLIVWLILLLTAFIIFLFLLYLIYFHKIIGKNCPKKTYAFFNCAKNPHKDPTLLNMKLTCKNQKCLCQYRCRTNSSLYLTSAPSINILDKQTNFIRIPSMKSDQLRYAKIKQIRPTTTKNLDKKYLTGQFRTIVKLKSLPN